MPSGSVPRGSELVTLSVEVLRKATLPAPGESGNVELTTSSVPPDAVSAIGPAFRSWTPGNSRVTGTNASSLPVDTSTICRPPRPITYAFLPLLLKAIDCTGPASWTAILRDICIVAVFTTQTMPEKLLPAQTAWPLGVFCTVIGPLGSATCLTTTLSLVRTTARLLSVSSEMNAYCTPSETAAVTAVAPSPMLTTRVTLRVSVSNTF